MKLGNIFVKKSTSVTLVAVTEYQLEGGSIDFSSQFESSDQHGEGKVATGHIMSIAREQGSGNAGTHQGLCLFFSPGPQPGK